MMFSTESLLETLTPSYAARHADSLHLEVSLSKYLICGQYEQTWAQLQQQLRMRKTNNELVQNDDDDGGFSQVLRENEFLCQMAFHEPFNQRAS